MVKNAIISALNMKRKNIKRRRKAFVAMYTNEGLKFQMVLDPLKFEPLRRGRLKAKVVSCQL